MIREETHFVEKKSTKTKPGWSISIHDDGLDNCLHLAGCAVVMQLGSLFCSFLKHKMAAAADLKTHKIP